MANEEYGQIELRLCEVSDRIIMTIFVNGRPEIQERTLNVLLETLLSGTNPDETLKNIWRLSRQIPNQKRIIKMLHTILYDSNVDWKSVGRAYSIKSGYMIMLHMKI